MRKKNLIIDERAMQRYEVIHPLDDRPEEKISLEDLGPMHLTPSVKWSLLSLRAYLILMFLMVLCYLLRLAGIG